MRIRELEIYNFRGFEELKLKLDPHFNIIVGNNGSGKTAILEALTVAMGSYFLGIRNTDSRHILNKDIHIKTFEHNEEYVFPVVVRVRGEVQGVSVDWARSLKGRKNRTTSRGASSIKRIATEAENQVRAGQNVELPLLVYYATGRLFDLAQKNKSTTTKQISSRFRAYDRCLEAKSTHNQFQKWFKAKEISIIQKRQEDLSFNLVKKAIVENVPDCKDLYYEFDPDKPEGLKMLLEDERILSFNALSDGSRNFLAIMADLAHKCVTLNPQLQEEALKETKGIVLIDELDLHLHPEWQRRMIKALKSTFPNLQFVVSTHSPFLIQEAAENELIKLKNNQATIRSANHLSIEDIAEEIQDVENPQWSKSRQYMFEQATAYYKAVKEGRATPEMKAELDKAMKPFAKDTAFYAILEQERIIQERQKGKE